MARATKSWRGEAQVRQERRDVQTMSMAHLDVKFLHGALAVEAMQEDLSGGGHSLRRLEVQHRLLNAFTSEYTQPALSLRVDAVAARGRVLELSHAEEKIVDEAMRDAARGRYDPASHATQVLPTLSLWLDAEARVGWSPPLSWSAHGGRNVCTAGQQR